MVSDVYNIYNAVYTANYNLNRKKGKKPMKLFKKKQKKADMRVVEQNFDIVKNVEKKEGKSWVQKIYEANGLKRKEVK